MDKSTVNVVDVFQLEQINTLPITANKIASETNKDKELSELLKALQTGKQIHRSKHFQLDQTEFSLHNGVIMRSYKVCYDNKGHHTDMILI